MRSAFLFTAFAVGLSMQPAGVQAQTATTIWADIMSKKKLTTCIVPSYQP